MQTWVYAAIGAAGLIAGSFFKAAFMIAASIVIAFVLGCMSVIEGQPAMSTLGSMAAGMLSFQFAYLVGLLVSSTWNRTR